MGINTKRGWMHYGFVILICCCLMMGINVGLVFSCAGIFYAPVSEAIGVSQATFGYYMPIMYVTSTIMLFFAGSMMERMSARMLLGASSGLMGLSLLAMALFNSVWEFYIAGGVIGLTLAFLLYLSYPTMINRWFHTNVGLLMGICVASSGIGGVIFNPIGGAVIQNFGWRWGYALFGAIILLIVTPLLFILLRNHPSDMGLKPYGAGKEGKKAAEPLRQVEYADALRMPIFYGIMIFAFMMMACSTLNLYIPSYAKSLGFTIVQGSILAAAVMVGVTLGKLALGYINDRNCVAGVLVTTVGGIAGLALLIFCGFSLRTLCIGAFLFGWAYAGVTVQTAMLTRSVFGTRDYARIFSIVSIALAAGGAVASGMWGMIVEGSGYDAIFIIGVAMLLVCTVIGLRALRKS